MRVQPSALKPSQKLLEKIYDFNFSEKISRAEAYRRRSKNKDGPWAGIKLRTQLHLAFVLAFVCLLRADEVLRIRWSDLRQWERSADGEILDQAHIRLTLNFRKNAQCGGESELVCFGYAYGTTSNRIRHQALQALYGE
jgi:hypothetical protein